MLISLFAARAVHRQHLAAGLGAAGAWPSACGRSSPSWPARPCRRSCSGSGSSRPSRRRKPPYIEPQHRRPRATRSAWPRSTTRDVRRRRRARRRRPRQDNADTVDNIRLWDPDRHAGQLRAATRAPVRLLRDQRRRRRPLRDRRRDDPGDASPPATCTDDGHPAAVVGGRSTSPTPTATAWCWRRPTPRTTTGSPSLAVRGRPGQHEPRRARGQAAARSTSARTARLRHRQHRARRRSTTRTTTATTSSRPTRARTASTARLVRPPGRLRPALRRHQPADLRQPQARLKLLLQRDVTTGSSARAVPRSSTPTRTPWSSTAGSCT